MRKLFVQFNSSSQEYAKFGRDVESILPERDSVINEDDIDNLRIALNTMSIDEIIRKL